MLTGPKDRRTFIASALAATSVATLSKGSNAEQRVKPDQDTFYSSSTSDTTLSGEAADRLAIRRLVDAWAYCADRRLADRQTALFIPDGTISSYLGDPAKHKPVSTLKGHAEIRPALDVLKKFLVTTHFNGQSDVVIKGTTAQGKCYCLAHQLLEENGRRELQVLSIRYQDDYVRLGASWLFAHRNLIIEWSDTRPSIA